MKRSLLPLEDVFRLLPPVAELDELRLALIGAAIADPDKEWAKSATHSTIDKRVVGSEQIEGALDDAEAAVQAQVQSVFGSYRSVLGLVQSGAKAEAAARLVELGEEEERHGRFGRARGFFDAALSLSLPLPDKAVQTVALRRIGRVLRAQGDLGEALLYYNRSAEMARDAGDPGAEVVARIGAGTVLGHQGRWAEAETAFRAALARVDGAGGDHELERGQIYNNLAAMATRQDHFDEAEVWFRRALEHWQSLESAPDAAVCHYNLGILRKRQGRADEAAQMFHQALSLSVAPAYRAVIATDLAQFYAEQGHPGSALEWAQEAERQAVAARSPYVLGHMYLGLGNMARVARDESGFVYYEKALEIARRTSLGMLEGETLLGYALLRRDMGETEEAQAYLERAIETFRAIGTVHERARAEQELAALRVAPGRIAAS